MRTFMMPLTALLSFTVCLGLAPSVGAQEAPAPEPTAQEATPIAEQSTPAQAGEPGSEEADTEEPAAAPGHFPRFRFGISFMGGPLVGGLSGGVGGVDTRFGVQLSELLAIEAQPVVLMGAGATGGSASGAGLGRGGPTGRLQLL